MPERRKITLTPEAIEELKDTVKFRTKVILTLENVQHEIDSQSESLDVHCKTSERFRNDVVKLKTHRTMQWFFISGIISVLVFYAAKGLLK